MLNSKVYKQCSKKCGKCPSCKAFAKVLREIDLTKVSKHEIETKNRRLMND
jgi:7-cyano-7-deazaguanine synthase in queuosine biosynthesis